VRATRKANEERASQAGAVPARVIARVQRAALGALISVVVGLLERRMRAALDRRR